MMQLRLLGSVDLLGADGRDVESLLRRPKRLALLGYLAAARPRGFHRRDTLLALFWPDLDQSHARNALRQAVHYVRHSLGPNVVTARGEEELGIACEHLSCDVAQFEQHLDGERPEAALALYGGELLAGFHLADASEFEHWLDREREHLRKRAIVAALALAEQEESRGGLIGAARWTTRAIEISPYDEGALRRLLRLLDQAGDRAEAIYEYDAFARRLAADLSLAPAPETASLAQAIRARVEARHGASHDVSPAPATGTPPVATSALAQREASTGPAGRRRWTAYAAGLTALAIAALGVRQLSKGAGAMAGGASIAVLPFRVVGPERELWREGMVDLLSANLHDAVGLREIDPRRVLSRWRSDIGEGVEAADPRDALQVGRALGATHAVLGSAVAVAGTIRLSAEVHDLGSSRLVGTASVLGPLDSLFDVVNRLSVEILRSGLISESADRPPVDIRRITTASLPALRAYLRGEVIFRRGRYREASELFRQAIQADSTFALAYERLAMSLPFWDDIGPATVAVNRAIRYGPRLLPRQRRLLNAFSLYLRGHAHDAEVLYRAALAEEPGDADAWWQFGGVLMMYNPLRGRSSWEGHHALLQAIELDPEYWHARLALSYLAALDEDHVESDRWLAGTPLQHEYALYPKTVAAFRSNAPAAQERQLGLFRAAPPEVVLSGARYVAVLARNLDGAGRIARWLTAPSRHPEVQAVGYSALAHLALARGRPRAARAALDSAAARDAGLALLYRALFAAVPFLPADTTEISALADALVRWDAVEPSADPTQGPALVVHRGLRPALRLYLLGLLSTRRGDLVAAERYSSEFARLEKPEGSGALLHDLANSVRAQVAWKRGRPAVALGLLENTRREPTVAQVVYSPFYSEALERFTWAEVLRELGRDRDGLAWYGSLDEYSVYDVIYAPPSYLRRAEIYERLGEREAARREYVHFLRAWSDCEPELRPIWEEGRRALARLGGGTGR
jgi:DNA-binding SARP family transcriptional activator/TolB-like protein